MPTKTSATQRARVSTRLPGQVQATLQQAADLTGATLNQFMLQAALEKAARVIEYESVLSLSAADSALLLDALEHPAGANRALRQAMQDYRKRMLDASHTSFDWKPQSRKLRLRKSGAERVATRHR
jgi:uncharacterized protein (DUF1778 family)